MRLFEVTAPRKSRVFNPTKFYRTQDFRSSSSRPKRFAKSLKNRYIFRLTKLTHCPIHLDG